MASLKIKKGDTVRVIAGKDKEKEGKVLAVNAEKGTVVVEGVNMIKRHLKPGKETQEGGIITQEGPIHISNVMYFDTKEKATTKIGYKGEGGQKVRISRKTGAELE